MWFCCFSDNSVAGPNVRKIVPTASHSMSISIIIKVLIADLDLVFEATVGLRLLVFTALEELGVLALTWLTLQIVSIIVVVAIVILPGELEELSLVLSLHR